MSKSVHNIVGNIRSWHFISQLLELLLDVNDSNRIPSHLRYDLRSPPPDESAVPELVPDHPSPSHEEIQQAQAALQEARMDFHSGQINSQEYSDTEAALSTIIAKGRTLRYLLKATHSTLDCVPFEAMPEDLKEDTPTGLLSPAHEDEYLTALDAYLDEPHPDDHPLPPRPRPTDREKDRETQLRNPMSVYNWLSNHRPKVLMDDDAGNEKPTKAPRKTSPKPPTSTPAPARSNAKREKASVSLSKPEEEILDEDGSIIGGFVEEAGGSIKKRKRGEDDDAYRPKGGGSKKRKRASTKNSNTGGSTEGIPRSMDVEGMPGGN